LINSSLCQIVSEPTRFRQNQNPSTLDLILVNDPALVSQVDYLSPIGKSDHITLLSTIQLLVTEIPKKDYDIHRHFSNTVSANLHKARQAYEENLSTDPKKVYKYIRRSLNTKVSVPQLRNDDESLCFDDNKTANI
ncbi:unnamed protein product, partial [Tenebrio molitor]